MSDSTSSSSSSSQPLVIHATNVLGLGAQQVVLSLLDAMLPLAPYDPIKIFLPEQGALADYHCSLPNVEILGFRRKLPHQLSRLKECIWPSKSFGGPGPLLVLGDVPLARRKRQVVLLHQPHMLAPSVNPHVGQTWSKRTMREVFRRNQPFADAIIVQTGVMADHLASSYQGVSDRLHVIPQPPPSWALNAESKTRTEKSDKLSLFYPAAGYPHKNHRIFVELESQLAVMGENPENLTLSITLSNPITEQDDSFKFVKNLGRLDVAEVLRVYRQSDALFFPSLLESFGLPLVEAICTDMPIVCADLPYAHWLCEDQAFYFDPESPEDAVRAIRELRQKLGEGWRPDYTKSRAKLPDSWEEVAMRFLEILATV